MKAWKRTVTCGELTEQEVGKKVVLNGWVDNRRDHGKVFFIDIRDRYGTTQVVVDGEERPGLMEAARKLGAETVVSVSGTVRRRAPGQDNPQRKTGKIEVSAEEMIVLSRSDPPPFEIVDKEETSQETRLKFRYLDLRRKPMQEALEARSRFIFGVREFLHSRDFVEVETPILTKATPEGARDFLVPSRIHPGKFYALPQSPQLFKQLLMVGGLDRYFQIARCFRDEDLRADRQPEFTQIDMEMSFVDEGDVLETTEEMLIYAFKKGFGIGLPSPFPRMTYREAMERFGTDKPDLRFGMEICDISDIAKESGSRVFSGSLGEGGKVKAICVSGGESFSRKGIEELEAKAKDSGAKGLLWMRMGASGGKGPASKFFTQGLLERLAERLGVREGDLILFCAGKEDVVLTALGAVRVEVASRMGLPGKDEFKCLWVTDFPLFEKEKETGRWGPSHHPFTAPRDWELEGLEENPGSIISRAYDLVINGAEVGSGSVRIHKKEVQERIFSFLGITRKEAEAKFGFLLKAFQFGAPPHGGIALGVDRLVAIALGVPSIREVIAFPKTANATCLLTDAPSYVGEEQLRELHIRKIEKGE